MARTKTAALSCTDHTAATYSSAAAAQVNGDNEAAVAAARPAAATAVQAHIAAWCYIELMTILIIFNKYLQQSFLEE